MEFNDNTYLSPEEVNAYLQSIQAYPQGMSAASNWEPIPYETEGERLAREAYEASIERKKFEQIERKCLEQLKALADNKTTQFGDFELQKSYRAGSIDYSIIPELRRYLWRNIESLMCPYGT